jgi:hypothetical protein
VLASRRNFSYAARTRARSRANPARPYICRLSRLRRVTFPSVGPLLHVSVRPATTASQSRRSPAQNCCSSAILLCSTAAIHPSSCSARRCRTKRKNARTSSRASPPGSAPTAALPGPSAPPSAAASARSATRPRRGERARGAPLDGRQLLAPECRGAVDGGRGAGEPLRGNFLPQHAAVIASCFPALLQVRKGGRDRRGRHPPRDFRKAPGRQIAADRLAGQPGGGGDLPVAFPPLAPLDDLRIALMAPGPAGRFLPSGAAGPRLPTGDGRGGGFHRGCRGGRTGRGGSQESPSLGAPASWAAWRTAR